MLTIEEFFAGEKKKAERITKETRQLAYHRRRRALKAQQRAERARLIPEPQWEVVRFTGSMLNAEEAREQRRVARRRRMKRRGWC